MHSCLVCGKKPKRSSYTFCSNKCQSEYNYHKYIEKWHSGEVDGGRVVVARNISRHIVHYLIDKYSEKCTLCGWDVIHPITGRVPLEVDHLNGNSEDNREENLRLICPNCHSLSKNYKNLNKGKGRAWRTAKYLKINI